MWKEFQKDKRERQRERERIKNKPVENAGVEDPSRSRLSENSNSRTGDFPLPFTSYRGLLGKLGTREPVSAFMNNKQGEGAKGRAKEAYEFFISLSSRSDIDIRASLHIYNGDKTAITEPNRDRIILKEEGGGKTERERRRVIVVNEA